MIDFDLYLVDVNPEVVLEFDIQFAKYKNVFISLSPFEQLEEFDCLVSPANSFGIMDGGVDKNIIDFFGNDLQSDVHNYILKNFAGEQPIGTCFLIETHHTNHPFLAHTPTMRVPGNIQNTDNIYKAMKAMLLSVCLYNQSSKNKIKSVACPGLGTLTGEVVPTFAVEQMALAYEHILNPPKKIDWTFASYRSKELEIAKYNSNLHDFL